MGPSHHVRSNAMTWRKLDFFTVKRQMHTGGVKVCLAMRSPYSQGQDVGPWENGRLSGFIKNEQFEAYGLESTTPSKLPVLRTGCDWHSYMVVLAHASCSTVGVGLSFPSAWKLRNAEKNPLKRPFPHSHFLTWNSAAHSTLNNTRVSVLLPLCITTSRSLNLVTLGTSAQECFETSWKSLKTGA